MLAAAVACQLGTDLTHVVGLSVAARDSLEEYDTLIPQARALNGRGESTTAALFWATLDTAILTVLDSTTGKTVVNHVGLTPGRLQVRAGTLFSNPLDVRPLAAADTVFPTGATTLTDSVPSAAPPDSLSDSLKVELADTITTPGAPPTVIPLAGRPIVFTITHATAPASVTLVLNDTARTRVSATTLSTSGSGISSVKVRLLPGAPSPDTVVVTASARRAVGTPVPGSPVTFVVRFTQ